MPGGIIALKRFLHLNLWRKLCAISIFNIRLYFNIIKLFSGQVWPPGALEHAMFEALDNDRVDFVRLLLEQGVNMNKFLNVSRLEALYNSRNGPANTLNYIVRDVVPRMPKGYQYTLLDIGLVINQLMGSGYCSTYIRRKFRNDYSNTHTPARSKTVVSFAAQNGDVKAPTMFEKVSTVRFTYRFIFYHRKWQIYVI